MMGRGLMRMEETGIYLLNRLAYAHRFFQCP